MSGDHIKVQWVKLPLVTASPSVFVQVPASLLLIQIPACAPGKAAEDGPRIRGPTTHVGEPDGILGSWLEPGPVLAVWGSELMAGRSLSLTLSVCPSLSLTILGAPSRGVG